MKRAEYLGIENPHALSEVLAAIHRVCGLHRSVCERIDAISVNDGHRRGLRTRYEVRLSALVRAANDLIAFHAELDNALRNAREDAAIAELLLNKTKPKPNRK